MLLYTQRSSMGQIGSPSPHIPENWASQEVVLFTYIPVGNKQQRTIFKPMCSYSNHSDFLISLMLLLLSRFSRVRLCATPQTAAHQALPSLGFSRQEYWSGLPLPSPSHFPRTAYFFHENDTLKTMFLLEIYGVYVYSSKKV